MSLEDSRSLFRFDFDDLIIGRRCIRFDFVFADIVEMHHKLE